MKDVLEDVDTWTARGDAVALATVIGVKRSAPRPPGTKMAVNEHGEISGAVSGGCVVWREITDLVVRRTIWNEWLDAGRLLFDAQQLNLCLEIVYRLELPTGTAD